MKSVSEIFSEQGSLANLIRNFKHRPEQEAMANAILDAIKKGDDLICEAGTGTGKTLAYLVPVLLASQKTIVSTGTKHLQDQLKQKDLPIVLEALNQPATTMVLKGRANYLCLERMETALGDPQGLSVQQITDLQEVAAWSSATETGDINELNTIKENTTISHLITSTTENCLGQGCPKYDACFVFKNRKAAMDADLVITNHHLLLADMSLRESGYGEVLPLADIIIFDEAHQLPELASVYFSQVMSSRQLLELITDIKTADKQEAGDIDTLDATLDHFEKTIRDVRLIFGRKDRRVSWQAIWESTALPDKLAELFAGFQSVLERLEPASSRGSLLDNCWQRAKAHYDYLENYSEKETEENIRWVEIKGHHLYLNQTPVNIAETFQNRLQNYNASTVFTSASLAVDNDFHHFNQQLGLQDTRTRIWDSPFNYAQQTRLYLPLDLPEPGHADFFTDFIERASELLSFSQGHAFVLFTSHRSLSRAADRLDKKRDYPLFVQGHAPRSDLLNRFRQTKHAVLLGTSSFWEGVDVKGDALSLVIIEKLPFASPDDPVLQARLDYLSKQGANPFMEYQLPQAAIILKQGIGRLIRDSDDRGICVICDNRIVNKAYGRHLIKSLPPMPITHELGDVKKFFAGKKQGD